MFGNARRDFGGVVFQSFHLFQASYFGIINQSMAYRVFSKESLSVQCRLEVFHRFHYFYYV